LIALYNKAEVCRVLKWCLNYEIKKQNNNKSQYVINKNGKLLTTNS